MTAGRDMLLTRRQTGDRTMTPNGSGPRRRSQRRAFQLDERQRARQAMTWTEHTAAMIVSVAQASNPSGDPFAIAVDALAMAGVGPDYGYDQELFAEAADDYAAMEEGSL